jgi:predicted O-methyltransferase YrrM
VLDNRVLATLRRLEEEDSGRRFSRWSGRSYAIAPTTGRLLFALVAPRATCQVLEIGASRGYSSVWLAAGARTLGGHLTSLERDAVRADAWRANLADAGLEPWADLVEGDAHISLEQLDGVFDVVFLDAWKDDYEEFFALARRRLTPGSIVVADNVLSHRGRLGEYSRARQCDPSLSSVTLPLDSGLEVTVVLE